MTGPYLSGPLGSYPDREEFQVDRTIINVMLPAHGDRRAWLARADELFEDVWRAVPLVILAAQQNSRVTLQEFWKAHDEAGTSSEQLAVWGIWIDPETGAADYHVGCNHVFMDHAPAALPGLPDDYTISVHRNPTGHLETLD